MRFGSENFDVSHLSIPEKRGLVDIEIRLGVVAELKDPRTEKGKVQRHDRR